MIDQRLHWISASGWGWQVGEQGMLQAIVDVIGLPKGVFVEVGAGNGSKELPLTCQNLLDQGWGGVLVEMNPVKAEQLRRRKGSDTVFIVEAAASPENIDSLVPDDADVVVIDVDSIDILLWENLTKRPAVVIVEHHDLNDPDVPKDKPSSPDKEFLGKPKAHGFIVQANHLALDVPAQKKGYTCVARTRFNSFYVLDGFVPKLMHRCEGVISVISQPRLGFSDMEDCIRKSLAPLGVDVFRYNSVACWEKGLTAVMQEAVNGGFEFVITLDFDSTFTPADVVRLVNIMRDNPDIDAVFPVQANRHTDMPQCFEPGLDYSGFLTNRTFGHFGCTVIRLSSLAKMPKPWFWAIPDPNTGEWESPWSSDNDITFWRNAKELGWRVCQANKVQIGHIELCVKWLTDKGTAWQPAPNYMKFGRPPGVSFNPSLYEKAQRPMLLRVIEKKDTNGPVNADRADEGTGRTGEVGEAGGSAAQSPDSEVVRAGIGAACGA